MKPVAQRQKNLLRWIVKSYIEDTKPVGSQHLVKKYRLDRSPATVRNEMACLEEDGYIQQPHTSAGRIPTDKGYRYYVSHLMKKEHLASSEREHIRERMEHAAGNVNVILEEASRILGKVSKELGVVLTPWISWGVFDRMELIELTDREILAAIHVQSRMVKTVILELESDLGQEDLEKTAAVLNERLSGLTLEEIQRTIEARVHDASRANRMVLRRIVEAASNLFDFSEPLEVHTCGTQNILAQPEFENTHLLESILGLIDNKRHLIQIFHKRVDDTKIIIGCEHQEERLRNFSIVTACYQRGRDVGTLGVIGPTRMKYGKIVPLMDFMAKTMTQYLS